MLNSRLYRVLYPCSLPYSTIYKFCKFKHFTKFQLAIVIFDKITYLRVVQLARHSKTVYLIVDLDAADLIAGMGGQDILRRYLTFFFWVQTWQFGFYRKKRQSERPLVMTIRSSASTYRRGDVLHIILTWTSCLAYLCRRQPRPVPGVSKSMTPTSFFCARSGRVVAGQKHKTTWKL